MTQTQIDTLHAKARESIAALCEDTLDDERDTVEYEEIEAVAEEVGLHVTMLVGLVKGYGLKIGARQKAKEVRGFTSNSHDRWSGKGSCASHGGSGWEQIAGFAGRKG